MFHPQVFLWVGQLGFQHPVYLFHYQQTNLNVDHSWCHMYLNGKFVSIANARFPSATVSSFIIESLQFSQSYKVKSLHFFFTRDVRQMGSYQTKWWQCLNWRKVMKFGFMLKFAPQQTQIKLFMTIVTDTPISLVIFCLSKIQSQIGYC